MEDLDAEGGEGVPPSLKEKAASLVSRLPSLLPKDPETAAVISRAMAEAFGVDGRARTQAAPQKEEITQADAERIYEEMMKK